MSAPFRGNPGEQAFPCRACPAGGGGRPLADTPALELEMSTPDHRRWHWAAVWCKLVGRTGTRVSGGGGGEEFLADLLLPE